MGDNENTQTSGERAAANGAASQQHVGRNSKDSSGAAAPRSRATRPAISFARQVSDLRHRPYWSWSFPHLDRAAPVPMGSLVYLIGATGRGKSSFALQVARAHAESRGPALVFSAELAAEYACARLVSQVTPTSWFGVIRGEADEASVQQALDVPRLRLTDQVGRNWTKEIEAEIRVEQEEHPGELVLVVVDYLQILHADARETRERVASASTALRQIAARTGVVILALSKASRVVAQKLRSGELVGSDAIEAGAETNSIEHDAVAQVQLGAVRDVAGVEPGVRVVDVSIAKARFGTDDVVIPFEMNGAHGWFREHGDVVRVSAVQAEARAEKRERALVQGVKHATTRIVAVLEAAPGPLSVNQIFKSAKGRKKNNTVAFATLIQSGDVMKVQGKRRGGAYPYALTARLAELELQPVGEAQA